MAKKPRLKDDAFAWVQDTSEKKPAPEPPVPAQLEKPLAATRTKKQQISPTGGRQRAILVKYDRSTGQIIACRGSQSESGKSSKNPWSKIPKDNAVAEIDLPGELADKELIEIHAGFKIDASGAAPRLINLK